MSNPYLSEIRLMAFSFAPNGWMFCNGQTLPIQQYQALFALLGTTYGGDGIRTFQLPNLQGRVPLHFGSDNVAGTYAIGAVGGEATHTLTIAETPQHTHPVAANNSTAGSAAPGSSVVLAQAIAVDPPANPAVSVYAVGAPDTSFAGNALQTVGGQPHPNQQPYLTLNFCIALQGIFPSRN